MEMSNEKSETADQVVERVLLKMNGLGEADLRRIRDGVDQLIAEKGRTGDAGVISRTEQPKSPSQQPEPKSPEKPEELNQYGLPRSWASNISLQGLERIRESLSRTGSADGAVVQAVLKDFLAQVRTEYRGYRGDEASFDMSFDIRGSDKRELSHLVLSREERLKYLQQQYPKGFSILGTPKYIKWEVVAPFELWAMQRHGQSYATLNRRGGCSPREIIAIVFGIASSELRNYSDEEIMEFFEKNEFIAD